LLGRTVAQPTLAAGDLVFFDTLDRGRVTHVAVYLGEGEIAHASSSKGVMRTTLAGKYFQRAYVGSKRILAP
jgi:cell wall-associated NlpC family hydrolase